MVNRFGAFLASRPERTVAIVVALTVALLLMTAVLALKLSDFGEAPYPSNEMLIELVDGKIVYTFDSTTTFMNETPAQSFPYSGMRIKLQVGTFNGYTRMGSESFGSQTVLGSGVEATFRQSLMSSSWANVSIDITDSTGDGSFDMGDTIAFDIDPLGEGIIFTFGLLWENLVHGGAMAMEISFALDDGKLYAWYSDYLNDTPWYEPYLND